MIYPAELYLSSGASIAGDCNSINDLFCGVSSNKKLLRVYIFEIIKSSQSRDDALDTVEGS